MSLAQGFSIGVARVGVQVIDHFGNLSNVSYAPRPRQIGKLVALVRSLSEPSGADTNDLGVWKTRLCEIFHLAVSWESA